jgi:hypothetical protein
LLPDIVARITVRRVPAKDPAQRRETARAWYRSTEHRRGEADVARRSASREVRKRAIIAWYAELKSQLACQVCGEDHPACIQFHHPDPTAKEISVADAVRRGWSRARINRELQKCEVLCANCHAKHHARGLA